MDADEQLVDRPETWPVHGSEDALRGGMPFAVRVDEVSLPDDHETFSRLVIEHPGAVVVLAVDDEDRALVLRQYRHAVASRMVELPAGLLDEPGEDPLEAARRELLEETGYAAEEWVHLNHLHNSPGFSSEVIDSFLARKLRRADRGDFRPEHEEADMTVHWVPVDDLVRAVLARQVTDGPLVSAVLTYVVAHGEGRDPGR